ncbi:DHA2 family efflux MFS transporter permease subunit [Paenibacillus sp. JX-17]|uniref:DHA2 family efflux MFS transporter permease subunit n=1 Tax=Paenibacillus lacisoli TaxID=3064525 RepID=A0ABT9C9K5_9BACL|nr:DHA2 family efflux MFS transporter permease subunit [Paenibacillus sp. JX-17]MDO7905944.1 DHA2 family efflux MFS transporter permease subunit [Paenibacillus sp. JX-17]
MASNTVSGQAPGNSSSGVKQHLPLLIVLMVGLFLAILNQTLLNVALPHITNEFNITTNTAQWLLTGYMLVNGILIPLSAFLIDRFGVRLLFLAAMFCFTLGALVCSLADNFSVMLIGRLIQAVGGGVLSPLVMSVILFIFPPEMRGKGMGIFGLAMMFAPAVGPTLSGWVVQNYDWHLLFTGMIPPGIIVFIVALFKLRNIEEAKKIQLDYLGTISSLAGVGLLLYGLSEAGTKGWGDITVSGCIVVGVVIIAFFVIWEIRSRNPLLNMGVFRFGIFSLSNVINALVTASMYAGMLLLPLYLQNLRGFTPLESGLLMLPGALVMLIMSPISGILFDKIGPRPLAIIGMLITTVTTYYFTKLTMDSTYSYILVLYMVRFFGMSFLMMPIMTAGMNQLPRDLNKHGTAMSNTLRQVSGSIGTSVITTIFTNRTTFHAAAYSDRLNTTDPQFMQSFTDLVNRIVQTTHLPLAQAQTQAATLLGTQVKMEATVQGINDAFFWATIISIFGLVLSFFLRDVRKDKPKAAAVQETVNEPEILMLPAPRETAQNH